MKRIYAEFFPLHVIRKLLVFLLSFFVSATPFYSQSPNLAQHSYRDHSGKILHHQGNFYYTINVAAPLVDSAIICSVDKNLKGRFKKLIQKHQSTSILDMCVTLDGNIAILGRHRPCDYMDNNSKFFFMKIDTAGNTLIDNSFALIGGFDPNGQLRQDQDSGFVAMTEDRVFFLSKSGQLTNNPSGGSQKYYSMYRSKNKETFFSRQTTSSNELLQLDTFGFPFNIVNVPYLASSMERSSSGALVLLLTNGSIMKLDSSLSTISSYSVSSGSQITTMTMQRDTLYLTGTAPQGKPFYIVCDTAFGVISQYTCSTEHMVPKGIAAIKGRGAALLMDVAVPGIAYHTGVTLTSYSGTFQYSKDIGVSNLFLDSSYVYKTSLYWIGAFRLHVTVTNFGADTVRSFYLNAPLSLPPFCNMQYYHALFKNVVLPPLGTMTINTGFLTTYLATTTQTIGSTINLPSQCFYTSAPDFETDVVRSNDGMCLSTQTLLVTGSDETIVANSISVYPNPARSAIVINSSNMLDRIEVHNSLGMLISSQAVRGQETTLGCETWPPGVYFVTCSSENGTVTKKVVKN